MVDLNATHTVCQCSHLTAFAVLLPEDAFQVEPALIVGRSATGMTCGRILHSSSSPGVGLCVPRVLQPGCVHLHCTGSHLSTTVGHLAGPGLHQVGMGTSYWPLHS